MGFTLKYSDDLVTGLLRKQINNLNLVLEDVEEGRSTEGHAQERLKTVEQQIRWLRELWFEN